MKLGLYFRQAWYNLRVNRVYSAVFIAGTAVDAPGQDAECQPSVI